jgi:NTE family protein
MATEHPPTLQLPPRLAVVLGGGGLKGFAHIGVLRALEERGIRPFVYAGTSIGALMAAAYVGGMSLDAMEERARSLRKRDLFRINHMGMILERMRSPSLYLEEPLRELCASVVAAGTFEDLPTQLLVNTVEVEHGTQLVWGLPGLRHVPVVDAVYASCALPGFFPPGFVDGRVCIDGGTVDNLPVQIAAVGADAIIAVDVGNSDLTRDTDIHTRGFAAIYVRAASVMMHALQRMPLAEWSGPPMLLIRPRVSHHGWFTFEGSGEMIEAGYAAASAALDGLGDELTRAGGVYPRRVVELSVDRGRCIGCTVCVALAPRLMAMDATGKAYPTISRVEWSPADGDFVSHCPTAAISARPVVATGSARRDGGRGEPQVVESGQLWHGDGRRPTLDAANAQAAEGQAADD